MWVQKTVEKFLEKFVSQLAANYGHQGRQPETETLWDVELAHA